MLTMLAAAALTLQAGTPPVLQRMLDCRSVADSHRRLACFDREAGTVVAAQQAREIVVLDREQARRANPRAEAPVPREAFDSTIVSASMGSDGRYRLRLADGSTWLQNDSQYLIPPEAGETIRVRPAALGSYFANIGERRAIRVRSAR